MITQQMLNGNAGFGIAQGFAEDDELIVRRPDRVESLDKEDGFAVAGSRSSSKLPKPTKNKMGSTPPATPPQAVTPPITPKGSDSKKRTWYHNPAGSLSSAGSPSDKESKAKTDALSAKLDALMSRNEELEQQLREAQEASQRQPSASAKAPDLPRQDAESLNGASSKVFGQDAEHARGASSKAFGEAPVRGSRCASRSSKVAEEPPATSGMRVLVREEVQAALSEAFAGELFQRELRKAFLDASEHRAMAEQAKQAPATRKKPRTSSAALALQRHLRRVPTVSNLREVLNSTDLTTGRFISGAPEAGAPEAAGDSQDACEEGSPDVDGKGPTTEQEDMKAREDKEGLDMFTNFQLNRSQFFERIELEANMRRSTCSLVVFIMLIFTFLQTLAVYDPMESISVVHNGLRIRYQMEGLEENLVNVRDVLSYTDTFIKTTYDMASALVDANTMNSIDPMRCFDIETADICRLKYWEVQFRRKTDEHYVNLDALFQDQVSPLNQKVSKMDCSLGDPHRNCMVWSEHVDPNLTSAVMGLTPEDPVIVEDRRIFPYAQVVPLAPIVWQTRAAKVPCSGFGNTYNQEILGAGRCKSDIRCDADSVTSFEASIPNPRSGRIQSIFVAYENDAFNCYDHSKEETEFYDKSWDPWATYSDMTVGRKIEPQTLLGHDIFYKFISDVNYLKAPVKGTVFFNKSDPCTLCEEYIWPDCVDPIEEGPNHPMWSEESIADECSGRRQWISRFVDEEKTPEKESTFFTPDTKSFFLGALVITPQMQGLPDITTLVKIEVLRDQNGFFSVQPSLVSISETPMFLWVSCMLITLVFCLAYPVVGGYEAWTRLAVNSLTSMCVVIYLVWNLYLEVTPPHVVQELEEAFMMNQQEAYFKCFTGLLEYSDELKTLKDYGFYLILALFCRLIALLDIHPRLGLLRRVVEECADDTFHFLLQFALCFTMLSFLAFWSFGEFSGQYRSIGFAAYVLFQMFVGEFEFGETPPDTKLMFFLILYVFVIFVMMVNFLLAIVVNAHTKVMEYMVMNETEQNIILDVYDILAGFYYSKRYGWPSPLRVHGFLEAQFERVIAVHVQDREAKKISEAMKGGERSARDRHTEIFSMDLPAVTQAELCHSNDPLFDHPREAQAYINWYAKKLVVLREDRKHKRFLRGYSMLDEMSAPEAWKTFREENHASSGDREPSTDVDDVGDIKVGAEYAS